MPYNVCALYPNEDDLEFDKTYYLEKHMLLVQLTFKPYGLLAWDVIEFGLIEHDLIGGIPNKRSIGAASYGKA